MFQFSTKKLSLVGIWRDAFGLYKETFKKIWYFPILFSLLGCALLILTSKQNTPPPSIGFFLYTLFFGILLYYMSLMLHRMYFLVKEPQNSLKNSFSVVTRKFIPIFICYVIVILLYMVGAIFLVIPGIVLMVGAVLSVIYLIVLCVFTDFFIPLILFDNIRARNAIQESCKLVWGNWWKMFITKWIPVGLFTIIFVLVALRLELLDLATQNFMLYLAMRFLRGAIVGTIIMPYFFSIHLVQFNDLKIK